MMCLKVRSSIHATSAPTGTDDDMEGNDKASVLAGSDGKWHGRNWDAWARFFWNPGKSDRYGPFMTPPRSECTRREPKNVGCDSTAIAAGGYGRRAPGRVTGVDRF